MKKIILDKQQVNDLVLANRYQIDRERRFLSRCIDGRYPNDLNLAPLAIPGADAGELALIFAASNTYGFEVDGEKIFRSLVEVVGGVKNLQLHTDNHAEKSVAAAGCGHFGKMNLDPQAYGLEKDQLEFIRKKLTEAKKQGATEVVLHGDHLEGAVLQVRGNFSILPRFHVETEGSKAEVQVFVFQASLVDERHRALVQKIIDNQAVRLYRDLDVEYLYQVLSETTENHLMETVKRLAKGLPIYLVKFKDDGSFEIEEMGRV